MSQAPDAFLFDLGNVLINWDPRHLYRTLIADETEMERFLAEVCNHDWNVQMDAGRPFAEATEELVALHPDKEPLIRAYRDGWVKMLGGPIPGTVQLLSELRARNYRLYALTNWSAETFAIARGMHEYDFLDWFHHIVVSGEIRMVKPHPAIFHHAIERCRLEPARTLFIDDSKPNVDAAARLGFRTHHFSAPETLAHELAPLL